jgi:16S rRNA (guanine527-N7)-methyltransferase
VARLLELLDEAQRIGLAGPGPAAEHLRHADAMLAVLDAVVDPPARFLDLGSGAGLPGVPAALHWPAAGGVLLDSRRRAVDFLREAVGALDLADRVVVHHGRAEDFARTAPGRESHDLVLARAVAPPPVVTELAAALVRVGGALAVSERPGGDHWDPDVCQRVGFEVGPSLHDAGTTIRVLWKRDPSPDDVPRRRGRPAKHPLW